MVNALNLIQKYLSWYRGLIVTVEDGLVLIEDPKTGSWYHIYNNVSLVEAIPRTFREIGVMRIACGVE